MSAVYLPYIADGLDRCGVGYCHDSFSNDLTDGLVLLGLDLGDEQGVEMFYNAALTQWLRVTGDLQVIPPGLHGFDTAQRCGMPKRRSVTRELLFSIQ